LGNPQLAHTAGREYGAGVTSDPYINPDPPEASAHPVVLDEDVLPRRESLLANVVRVLHEGKSRNPDVFLVETKAGLCVVKDFSPRSSFVRGVIGPWLIDREIRAYRALATHPFVPRFLGRIDRMAFAVEYRPGERMSRRLRGNLPSDFLSRLQGAIGLMHRLGVVHLDLRHRSNVLVGKDGAPILIDFASAVCAHPSGMRGRFLLPALARIDQQAFEKWRIRLSAEGAAT
jgi:predicted Ser/Thr protein kinase